MNKRSKSNEDSMSCMFVGLDIHRNYMQVAIMNKQGSIGREKSLSQLSIIPDHLNFPQIY